MRFIKFVVLALLLLGWAGPALAGRVLDEEGLDHVTAGGVTATTDANGAFNFKFSKPSPNFTVSGDGTLSLVGKQLPGNYGSIALRDNAQQNLSSMVNVTAVNSMIQVLLNMNINVNSTVGSVKQYNLSGGF